MHDYSKLSGKKRLRFKDWLIERLDNGKIRGVEWIDRERGLFKIPWMHGSHKNWNATDVEIFRQWAIYSGKYNPTADQRSGPIKWKTNFRCTLNALHDFKEVEVREEHSPRGPKRYKIYSLKSSGKSKKGGLNALGKVEKRKFRKPWYSQLFEILSFPVLKTKCFSWKHHDREGKLSGGGEGATC